MTSCAPPGGTRRPTGAPTPGPTSARLRRSSATCQPTLTSPSRPAYPSCCPPTRPPTHPRSPPTSSGNRLAWAAPPRRRPSSPGTIAPRRSAPPAGPPSATLDKLILPNRLVTLPQKYQLTVRQGLITSTPVLSKSPRLRVAKATSVCQQRGAGLLKPVLLGVAT